MSACPAKADILLTRPIMRLRVGRISPCAIEPMQLSWGDDNWRRPRSVHPV
jgi:hypothetical protein